VSRQQQQLHNSIDNIDGDNSSSSSNNNRIRSLKEEGRYRRLQDLLQIQAAAVSSGYEDQHDEDDGCNSSIPSLSIRETPWTENLKKELNGLQSKGDPYDAALFSEGHAAFKRGHNQVLVHLAQNLGEDSGWRPGVQNQQNTNNPTTKSPRPVFYLDGKDGATTSALLEANFDRSTELFMANEWSETVQVLREPPFYHMNCHFGSALDCLRNHYQDVPFVAAYLDGCGGSPQTIIQMIAALLSVPRSSTLYIGFTLTSAEPSGRELIDRVQDVTKAILQLSREQGYYHMDHVMDDPGWFGIDPTLVRKHQEITTCWVVCRSSRKSESVSQMDR
jgi:hypothetical protein